MATKIAGGRRPGSKNHSLREERLIAQNAALKASLAAEKAKSKVKDAEKKELRAALAAAKKAPPKKMAAARQSSSSKKSGGN